MRYTIEGFSQTEAEGLTHYGDTLFPYFVTPWYESKETACKAWNRRV